MRNDDTDTHAKKIVDLAHPFGITTGKVIIDSDDMYALTTERIEIGG